MSMAKKTITELKDLRGKRVLTRVDFNVAHDAFGTCHNEDASMLAVPQAMSGKPRVLGLQVAKELDILNQLLSAPARPVVGVMGGAKVSDKIKFIRSLLTKVDQLLVGGAM